MAITKKTQTNLDNSDPINYPDGKLKDNDGSDDGTPLNVQTLSDMFEVWGKLMRLADIVYNNSFDDEGGGYQLVDALIALANKNNFTYVVDTTNVIIVGVSTPVLTIPVKMNIIKNNEILIGKANINYTGQTLIQGSDNVRRTIFSSSNFKTNDRVILFNNGGNIVIETLPTSANLDALNAALGYTKPTTEADEYAGTSTTEATTPYTNQLAFFRRTVGPDSGNYLATAIRNGLLSMADKVKIDNNLAKNTGWFSGVDVGTGSVGTSYPRAGDVVSAILQSAPTNEIVILVTMANAMPGNYFVRLMVESQGNIFFDNDCYQAVFKPVSATTFQVSIGEYTSSTQNLKIHIEAVSTV